MGTQRLTESFSTPFGSGCKVDREKGIIYDVLLCGEKSLNGARYQWGKIPRGRHKLYERVTGNCGHGDGSDLSSPICWYEKVYADDQGRPRAKEMHVYKSHPMAEKVFEAAERNAPGVGCSHVADCRTTGPKHGLLVEDIHRVIRVDVVVNPATTHTFYESDQGDRTVTIKQLLEKIAAKSSVDQLLKLRRLSEMDGMADLPVEPPADDASPDDGISAAFKAAIMSVVDGAMSGDMDPKEALGKIKKLLNSHGDINGDGVVNEEDAVETTEESARPKKATGTRLMEALDLAEKHKLRASKGQLLILANAEPGDRVTMIEEFKRVGGDNAGTGPRSRERSSTTRQTEQARTEAPAPVKNGLL